MAQSLSCLYVHIIFHTKNNQNLITKTVEQELHAYIGGVIKKNDSVPIKINGTENHIHVLAIMSKNIALAKFVEEIKRNSSRWIKDKGKEFEKFSWQKGYAGLSVSQSVLSKTKDYIENQKEHHKKRTFQEEYLMFLKEYGVDYDEDYIWTP